MSKTVYTDEQRDEALKLYAEVGPGEAGRRLHIPAVTISSWAKRAGIQSEAPAHLRDAIEAAQLTRKQKTEALVDEMLDEARNCVRDMSATIQVGDIAMKTPDRDRQALATAATTLIDKIQLLSGEATSRTEQTTPDQFAAYPLGAREAFDQTKAES